MFSEAIICGDFNFDNKQIEETVVYKAANYEDVISQFVSNVAFTMFKTPRHPAWRPDKILLKSSGGLRVLDGFIWGKFATPYFKQRQEDPELIEKDGIVRTPSDHLAVACDFKVQVPEH